MFLVLNFLNLAILVGEKKLKIVQIQKKKVNNKKLVKKLWQKN
jgi:hypothetical protein